jgi:hypothetical protein
MSRIERLAGECRRAADLKPGDKFWRYGRSNLITRVSTAGPMIRLEIKGLGGEMYFQPDQILSVKPTFDRTRATLSMQGYPTL